MSATKLPNVGPKSAAWLRQVGIHSEEGLREAGAVEAFMKVRRAGFKASLNLLYALEGALVGCHWQKLPPERRSELLLAVDAAEAINPTQRPRGGGLIEPTRPTADPDDPGPSLFDDERDERDHDDA
ncbi:MAG: TfoX/Sxy family protein [Xanthomonadales bacterium]|nr:TfoX/Sxy family protein [Xanthomonadales bacterium]